MTIQAIVTGGGYVTPQGFGPLQTSQVPVFSTGKLDLPNKKELFENPSPRYGRLDLYTKMGCCAIAIALRDAKIVRGDANRSIGIVTSSIWESTTTDLAYYEPVREHGPAMASPNAFSYTLPGIVHGEASVMFGLTGPTICVGEDRNSGSGRGISALRVALTLMAGGHAEAMVVGSLDDPPASPIDQSAASGVAKISPDSVSDSPTRERGAVFVVLETEPAIPSQDHKALTLDSGKLLSASGGEVSCITELFDVRSV